MTADGKALELVEAIRCAKINFEHLERALPALAASWQYRIAKHQLDCAVAIADGAPAPELQ